MQHGPFFRFDSGSTDAGRFIIFSSEDKIVIFYKAGTFIMDGTFKVVPLPFYQLFIIHIFYLSRASPYIYVLMSNKTEFLYEEVFRKIKDLFIYKPIYMISDFEKGMVNAAEKNF